jgi:hypothetical protein
MTNGLVQAVMDVVCRLHERRASTITRSIGQIGLTASVYAAGGGVAICGVLTLLAAACVALAPSIGVAAALAVTGGATIAIGLGAIALVVGLREAARRRRERARRIERAVREAESSERSAACRPFAAGDASQALKDALESPGVLASAAFTLVSVLGVRRTISVIGTGLSLLSAAASLAHLAGEASKTASANDDDEPRDADGEPRPLNDFTRGSPHTNGRTTSSGSANPAPW